MARQEVNAMHFFKSANTLDIQSCHSIFNATRRLFELILNQETPHALRGACSSFIVVAVSMGISSMLRLLRGPFSTFIDQELGSSLSLAMIQFLKSSSIEKGDSSDRSGTYAEQFWKSDKLFKDSSGSIDVALRVRNKLAVSSMRDMVLRWKEGCLDLANTTEPIRNTGRLSYHAITLLSH
jgi:hypothetical protein